MASIVNRKEHYLLRLLTLKIQVFKSPILFFISLSVTMQWHNMFGGGLDTTTILPYFSPFHLYNNNSLFFFVFFIKQMYNIQESIKDCSQ